MEWYESGALIIGLVVGLIALSVPVAFAFLVVSDIGMLIFIGLWFLVGIPWFDDDYWHPKVYFNLVYDPEADLWRVVIPNED